MNILKEWFLGSWNCEFIRYDYRLMVYREINGTISYVPYEIKHNNTDFKSIYVPEYKYTNCTIAFQILMFFVAFITNIIFAILHPIKFVLFSIWINPTSNLGKLIKENKKLVHSKQFKYST